MKLPNGQHAFVDIVKLRDYCLNDHHPRGRHKARVFAAALGLGAADAWLLREALLRAAVDAEAELGEKDVYGQRYVIDFLMAGPGGQATVRSNWIVLAGENYARLTSCYVL